MKEEALQRKYRANMFLKLGLSLLIDFIGMATFLLPGLGEFGDLFWAPIAALFSFFMFRGMTGATASLFTFAEELLPGTDWIPSLTLTWIYKYLIRANASYTQWHRHQIN